MTLLILIATQYVLFLNREYKIWTCDLPFRIRTLWPYWANSPFKNTNSDTFRTKAPLSARKEIMKNLWNVSLSLTLNGSESPVKVKFYCMIYTTIPWLCKLIFVTITQYTSIILRKSQFENACPKTLDFSGFLRRFFVIANQKFTVFLS